MVVPDRVVFDAEPLVAHADGEPGSEVVSSYLDAVGETDCAGFVSWVNLSEVRYILVRKYDRQTADEYVGWLLNFGVEGVDVGSLWIDAAEYVIEYNPALGDSFALATADHIGGTLLVGGDTDYDDVTGVPIDRFRDGSDTG